MTASPSGVAVGAGLLAGISAFEVAAQHSSTVPGAVAAVVAAGVAYATASTAVDGLRRLLAARRRAVDRSAATG